MKQLLGELQLDEKNLPTPIRWGRTKEPLARAMYHRYTRRDHRNLKILEKGLLLSEKFPVLGCSVDGVCI